jgi:ABC-type uncharacterized transport system substrate-binding protein
MRRRKFITLLGGTVAWPLAARAQQPRKMPRIGVLVSASPPHPFADAFRQGLRTLGYPEGQNIAIEFRYTEGRSDRAEEFAEELVRLGVDVIVAHFVPAVEAAMGATRTIPIVMAPHGAPLQLGAIDSLARPGGNVTGLSAMDAEIGMMVNVTSDRLDASRDRHRFNHRSEKLWRKNGRPKGELGTKAPSLGKRTHSRQIKRSEFDKSSRAVEAGG